MKKLPKQDSSSRNEVLDSFKEEYSDWKYGSNNLVKVIEVLCYVHIS